MVTMFKYTVSLYFCQHHRGRPPTQQIWVFGMVDTSHIPALGYMEIVQRQDAATLLPIIQAHVAPGTEIHPDEWAAYNSVAGLLNVGTHSVVNTPIILLIQPLAHTRRMSSPIGTE